MSLEEIGELLGKDMDFDEETFCRDMGRKNAKIDIYKNLYKNFYMLAPTRLMADLESQVDELKLKRLKRYAHIIIGCKAGTIFSPYGVEECQTIRDVLESRSWIASKKKDGKTKFKIFAIRAENKSTKTMLYTHPHIHCVVELSKLYSPGQITDFLWKCKTVRKLGVDARNCIKVIKGNAMDKKNWVDYANKVNHSGEFWVENWNVEL